MKVDKIYFDLDGVLADFDNGVKSICEIDCKAKTNEDDDKMWIAIRETSHFYRNLDMIDGMLDLFNLLYEKYQDKVEILTGIPKSKRGIITASEDKIEWCHEFLNSNLKVNIVYKEDKPNYCISENCILIDDTEPNITAWKEVKGIGILFTDALTCKVKLNELGII